MFALESHPLDPRNFISAGHDGVVNVWDTFSGEKLKMECLEVCHSSMSVAYVHMHNFCSLDSLKMRVLFVFMIVNSHRMVQTLLPLIHMDTQYFLEWVPQNLTKRFAYFSFLIRKG